MENVPVVSTNYVHVPNGTNQDTRTGTAAVSEMTQCVDKALKLSNRPADEVKNCLGGGKMIGQTYM